MAALLVLLLAGCLGSPPTEPTGSAPSPENFLVGVPDANDWYTMAVDASAAGGWGAFNWTTPAGTPPFSFATEWSLLLDPQDEPAIQAWGVLILAREGNRGELWNPIENVPVGPIGFSAPPADVHPTIHEMQRRGSFVQGSPYEGGNPFVLVPWVVSDYDMSVTFAFRLMDNGTAAPDARAFVNRQTGTRYALVTQGAGRGAVLTLAFPKGCSRDLYACGQPMVATEGFHWNVTRVAGPVGSDVQAHASLVRPAGVGFSWGRLYILQFVGDWQQTIKARGLEHAAQGTMVAGGTGLVPDRLGLLTGDPGYAFALSGNGTIAIDLMFRAAPGWAKEPELQLRQLDLEIDFAGLGLNVPNEASFFSSGVIPP